MNHYVIFLSQYTHLDLKNKVIYTKSFIQLFLYAYLLLNFITCAL